MRRARSPASPGVNVRPVAPSRTMSRKFGRPRHDDGTCHGHVLDHLHRRGEARTIVGGDRDVAGGKMRWHVAVVDPSGDSHARRQPHPSRLPLHGSLIGSPANHQQNRIRNVLQRAEQQVHAMPAPEHPHPAYDQTPLQAISSPNGLCGGASWIEPFRIDAIRDDHDADPRAGDILYLTSQRRGHCHGHGRQPKRTCVRTTPPGAAASGARTRSSRRTNTGHSLRARSESPIAPPPGPHRHRRARVACTKDRQSRRAASAASPRTRRCWRPGWRPRTGPAAAADERRRAVRERRRRRVARATRPSPRVRARAARSPWTRCGYPPHHQRAFDGDTESSRAPITSAAHGSIDRNQARDHPCRSPCRTRGPRARSG